MGDARVGLKRKRPDYEDAEPADVPDEVCAGTGDIVRSSTAGRRKRLLVCLPGRLARRAPRGGGFGRLVGIDTASPKLLIPCSGGTLQLCGTVEFSSVRTMEVAFSKKGATCSNTIDGCVVFRSAQWIADGTEEPRPLPASLLAGKQLGASATD